MIHAFDRWNPLRIAVCYLRSNVITWWSLIEWAVVCHFVAFGVAVLVAAFDIKRGAAWEFDAYMCYLLTVSITSYTYALFGIRRVPPPFVEPERPRVTYLPTLTLKRIERRGNQVVMRGIQTEWDELKLQYMMLENLKTNLRKNGRFSWRTMPKGMNREQYQRVREFLFSRGWAEEINHAAQLTELGRVNLSPVISTHP